MKILFMGTPPFAVTSLKMLKDKGHDIIGVITKEDTPKGRGMTMLPPAVKIAAEELNIPVYQPSSVKTEEFTELLSSLDPELIAVVAYGKILPKNVLDYPKHGCINLHGSILPEYRGAAPMQRAVIDGKTETGVTIQEMAEGMDTGDILEIRKITIGENDTLEDVSNSLSLLGAEALSDVIDKLERGDIFPVKQDESLATYAAKILREEENIDFSLSAERIHNKLRGFYPAPLCRSYTPDGKLLKLALSRKTDKKTDKAPGTVIEADKHLYIACGGGSVIEIIKVLPEGKSLMAAADYLRGRKLKEGDILCGTKA